MPATALIETRIDTAVKDVAAAVLTSLGLTTSDAVRLMLTCVAQEHALPFDPLIPNAETVEAMLEARRGGGLASFDNVQTLLADLDADAEATGRPEEEGFRNTLGRGCGLHGPGLTVSL